MRPVLAAAGLLLSAAPLQAYELQTLAVAHEHNVYTLTLQAQLHAKPERVFALLAKVSDLVLLNPSVKSVQVTAIEGGVRVRSNTEGCLAGFCRDLLHVQRLSIIAAENGGQITAITEAVPGSSFAEGSTRVIVTAEAGGTHFAAISQTVPTFWLPPVIGPYLLEQRMKEEALITLVNLEHLAGD